MSGPEQPSTDPRDYKPPSGGAPARRWLNDNVSPAVMEGLRWVTAERPDDPVRALGQFLIDYADGNRRHVPCVYDRVQEELKKQSLKAAQLKQEQPEVKTEAETASEAPGPVPGSVPAIPVIPVIPVIQQETIIPAIPEETKIESTPESAPVQPSGPSADPVVPAGEDSTMADAQ